VVSDGGNNQNLLLFICGNAVFGAPSIKNSNQFSKPIRIGIHSLVFSP
jgi:hypothetical protein